LITDVCETNLEVKGSAGAIAMTMSSNISAGSNCTQSARNTPVPYLLGGVGTMLVLIGFAVIFLAWSYFKDCRTGYSEEENNNRSAGHQQIVEHGDGGRSEMTKDIMGELSDDKDERVVVIMAGDDEPTFIAKQASVAVEV